MEAEREVPSIPHGADNAQGKGLSRRLLLGSAMTAAAAAVIYKISTLFFSYLKPPTPKNSFGGLIEIGGLNELPAQGGAPEVVPKGRFWLVSDTDGVYALHSSCTHLECLFSWDKDKGCFVCPCHGSEFDRKGGVIKGPAERALDRFPLRILGEDGAVVRQTDAQTGGPLPVADLQPQQNSDQAGGEPVAPSVLKIVVDTGMKIEGPVKFL